ncbi:hypothetical protein [Leifsonia sp. NPDC080035]|uniref:Lipoprotein n=1 Tax=Leifsonia sp. NPDC080035 TaxID=3143936 RepID=A0AAU7GH07_9MICO
MSSRRSVAVAAATAVCLAAASLSGCSVAGRCAAAVSADTRLVVDASGWLDAHPSGTVTACALEVCRSVEPGTATLRVPTPPGTPAPSLTVRLEAKDVSGAVTERSKDFAVAQTGCGQAYVTVRFPADGELTSGPAVS